MNDDQDIRGQLRRMASGHPLGPMDSGLLLDRGRRGKRRRRWAATGGGTLAAVSVVALVATMAPRLDARTTDVPPPASSPGRTTAAPDFTPLPGVPPGDLALAKLGNAEVARRCLLRGTRLWPDDRRFGIGPQATGLTVITNKVGERPRMCTIPGDSRPSAALIAAAAADPLPADDARRLRNCAVKVWHNLTGWRLVAKDTQPGVGTNLVALSPSGKFVLHCTLTARGQSLMDIGSIRPISGSPPGRMTQPPIAGHQTCGGPQACIGYLYSEAGQVARYVARIRLTASNGRTHDITVNDGWYALAWANGDPEDVELTVTEYDAAGRVLDTPR